MKTSPHSISVVLLAGGQGTRMRTSIPKQFIPLFGKPLARYSFDLFLRYPGIHEIVVVCEPEYRHLFTAEHISIRFALPGKRRQDSVFNGFELTNPQASLVCIHDSARPLLSESSLDDLFEQAHLFGAAALAVPAKNTIKEADPNLFIRRTLDRSTLWEMHTPQIATPALLRKGFEIIEAYQLEVTDDAAIVELTGHRVKLVPDSYRNIKITTTEDWPLAESYLRPPST